MEPLLLLQGGPERRHRGEGLPHIGRRHARGGSEVLATRLVDEGRHNGGQAGGIKPVPHSLADALSGQEVAFGIDLAQVLPSLGDREPALAEIAQILQEVTDPVEGARDGVGAAVDLTRERIGLPAQPPPLLGPPGVLLPIGARVAGVLPQGCAQPGDLRVGLPPRVVVSTPCLLYTSRCV